METTTLGVIASQASYEPFGGLKGITFANGIATTFTHDTRYQVKTIQAGTVLNRTFTHDFNGNVTSTVKNDTLPLPSLVSVTEDYTYVISTDWIDEIVDGTNVTALMQPLYPPISTPIQDHLAPVSPMPHIQQIPIQNPSLFSGNIFCHPSLHANIRVHAYQLFPFLKNGLRFLASLRKNLKPSALIF